MPPAPAQHLNDFDAATRLVSLISIFGGGAIAITLLVLVWMGCACCENETKKREADRQGNEGRATKSQTSSRSEDVERPRAVAPLLIGPNLTGDDDDEQKKATPEWEKPPQDREAVDDANQPTPPRSRSKSRKSKSKPDKTVISGRSPAGAAPSRSPPHAVSVKRVATPDKTVLFTAKEPADLSYTVNTVVNSNPSKTVSARTRSKGKATMKTTIGDDDKTTIIGDGQTKSRGTNLSATVGRTKKTMSTHISMVTSMVNPP